MSFDPPARPGGAAKVAFIAALGLECASLRRQTPRAPAWRVSQSGPGAARAAAAAAHAIDSGATRARLVGARRRARCRARAGHGRRAAPRSRARCRADRRRCRVARELGCAGRRVRARLWRPLERAGRARVARRQTRRGRGDSRSCRRYGVGGNRGGRGARARAVRGVARRRRRRRRRTAAKAPNDGSTSVGDRRMAATLQAVAELAAMAAALDAGRSVIASRAAFSTVSRTRLAARRLLAVAAPVLQAGS